MDDSVSSMRSVSSSVRGSRELAAAQVELQRRMADLEEKTRKLEEEEALKWPPLKWATRM